MNIRIASATLLLFTALFCFVTMSADTYMAGEVYGKACGFPMLWHSTGAASLSRTIFVPGLFVSVALYLMVAFLVARRLDAEMNKRKYSHSAVTAAALLGSVAAVFVFVVFLAVNFLSPQFGISSEGLGEKFSSWAIHFGMRCE